MQGGDAGDGGAAQLQGIGRMEVQMHLMLFISYFSYLELASMEFTVHSMWFWRFVGSPLRQSAANEMRRPGCCLALRHEGTLLQDSRFYRAVWGMAVGI